MANIFLFVVLFIVAVECHPFQPIYIDPESEIESQAGCNEEFESERNQIIAKSKCEPKEILVYLKPPTLIEEVSPGAIMVKRCVGICTFETAQDDTCVPTKTVKIPINLITNNAKTLLSRCTIYMVEEHQSCRCSCKTTPRKCKSQLYDSKNESK